MDLVEVRWFQLKSVEELSVISPSSPLLPHPSPLGSHPCPVPTAPLYCSRDYGGLLSPGGGDGGGGGPYVSPLMRLAWLRMVVDEGHSLGALSITDANNMVSFDSTFGSDESHLSGQRFTLMPLYLTRTTFQFHTRNEHYTRGCTITSQPNALAPPNPSPHPTLTPTPSNSL